MEVKKSGIVFVTKKTRKLFQTTLKSLLWIHSTYTNHQIKSWCKNSSAVLCASSCQHIFLLCTHTHVHTLTHRHTTTPSLKKCWIYTMLSPRSILFSSFYYTAQPYECCAIPSLFDVLSYCICHCLKITSLFICKCLIKVFSLKELTVQGLSIQSLKMPHTNWHVRPCLICNANKINRDGEL